MIISPIFYMGNKKNRRLSRAASFFIFTYDSLIVYLK